MNTNLEINKFSQTQPIKKYNADTNTNLPSSIFSQTQPIQYYEAGTNSPTNRIKTEGGTQTANTSTHNTSQTLQGNFNRVNIHIIQ